MFGHHFEVSIDLEYTSCGSGLATFEWWEKTDVPPPNYGDKVKPNEYTDIREAFRGDSMFKWPWDSRDTSSEGRRSVIEEDNPQMGILSAKAVRRTIEFDIVVKNPPCCRHDTARLHVTAKQELSTFDNDPTRIKTQEFITPNGPIQ